MPSTLLVVSRCVTDGTCATRRCLTSPSVSPTARRGPPRRASSARCRWWRRVCWGGGQPHSCGGGVLAPRCGLRGGRGGLGGVALFSGVVLTVWVNGHVVSGGAAAARDAVPGRAVRHRAGAGGAGGARPRGGSSRRPGRPRKVRWWGRRSTQDGPWGSIAGSGQCVSASKRRGQRPVAASCSVRRQARRPQTTASRRWCPASRYAWRSASGAVPGTGCPQTKQ